MEIIKRITGMNDILPANVFLWQKLESICTQIFTTYGYQEIRMPIMEKTALFSRSIGEVTDIVEKEMYTFNDLDGQSLTLRPEGTASCVRAYIENDLRRQACQRLWYHGPMFRHERPQMGRYRQFNQMGVEVFGVDAPTVDAELVLLGARLWQALQIHGLVLEINSLGSSATRQDYREGLVEYFSSCKSKLDEDSQRRLLRNPLRILDSKNPDMKEILDQAPKMTDYLDPESDKHFKQFCVFLDQADIAYRINPKLVRGLDYYNRTVFEWVTTDLGAQGAVCSGGRYDSLVDQLGGPPTPAMGFALGLERLILLMQKQENEIHNGADCYLVMVGENTELFGMKLAEQIRDAYPQLRLTYHIGGGSFKSQLKKADRSGADLALIIGERELEEQCVAIKSLRNRVEQEEIAVSELIPYIGRHLREKN